VCPVGPSAVVHGTPSVASTTSHLRAATLSRLRLQEHNRDREVTRLNERAAVWPARAVWTVTAVLVVANAALIVVAFPDLHPGDRFYNSLLEVGGLLFASVGLLIVVRARNVIGWILMGTGVIIQLVRPRARACKACETGLMQSAERWRSGRSRDAARR
jgi:protein-S-isoprenylcysteine O-methyltransferase Ste14